MKEAFRVAGRSQGTVTSSVRCLRGQTPARRIEVMAVATRHSDSIEVQVEDKDDNIYANETTVTARRTNVKMSVEGHYESLDLTKKDDAVYGDLQPKTRKTIGRPKKQQPGKITESNLPIITSF